MKMMKIMRTAILAMLVCTATQIPVWSQESIPYVPTTMPVVTKMLELASVSKDDLVYDMGCGDGRILIMAAKKYGARGVGIDLDPVRIAEAKKNAEDEGVSHLVEFRAEDGTKTDISKAKELKSELDKWNVYKDYEDRFLDLFKKTKEKGN